MTCEVLQCPSCGTSSSAMLDDCPVCGQGLWQTCPRCFHRRPASCAAEACNHCGYTLGHLVMSQFSVGFTADRRITGVFWPYLNRPTAMEVLSLAVLNVCVSSADAFLFMVSVDDEYVCRADSISDDLLRAGGQLTEMSMGASRASLLAPRGWVTSDFPANEAVANVAMRMLRSPSSGSEIGVLCFTEPACSDDLLVDPAPLAAMEVVITMVSGFLGSNPLARRCALVLGSAFTSLSVDLVTNLDASREEHLQSARRRAADFVSQAHLDPGRLAGVLSL